MADGRPDGGRTVGAVAALTGVTVRALHHWDEIGLLRPSGRTAAGYRVYDDADAARLQRLLLYRELGLPLEDIAVLLDDPDVDTVAHLRHQHEELTTRVARLSALLAHVEETIMAEEMGMRLSAADRLEVFGRDDPTRFADEAQQRWGETDAWAESTARARTYAKEDWVAAKAGQEAIDRDMAQALAAGEPPGSEHGRALAEQHRRYVERWFYDCPPEMHRQLAQTWVDDPRFAERYEALSPGLARWARDAAVANADAQTAGA